MTTSSNAFVEAAVNARRPAVICAAILGAAGGFCWLVGRPVQDARVPSPPRGLLHDVEGRVLTENRALWQPALNVVALRTLGPAAARRFLEALPAKLVVAAERIPNLDDRKSVRELHLPARVSGGQRDSIRQWLAASEWSSYPALLRFVAVSERVYPQHEETAALVGMVDSAGEGIEGMEHALDRRLRSGESLRLTVAVDLQKPLGAMLEKFRVGSEMARANAVVMDLDSGQVRAIVSMPGYDPTVSAQRTGRNVQLRAITQAFQAGPMLEPFLLHCALIRGQTRDAAHTPPLGRLGLATGTDLITQFSGHAEILEHLSGVGLLRAPDVDFPGAIPAIVRRNGAEAELLRDIGNGAGIAPSLLQYSASLASLIAGVGTRPVRLVVDSDATIAPEDAAADVSRASRLLREVLVQRARLRSGDASADFGGLWAAYRDRVDGGVGVGRAGLALFTPADSPNYLVTVTLEGEPLLAEQEVLDLGRRMLGILAAAKPAAKIQARRGTSFASRS
jgi:hypothetical protein